MQNNTFVGTWLLTGSFSENGEFEILQDIEEYRRIYENWLRAEDYKNIEKLTEDEGLEFEINSDGTFTEIRTGNPQIDWFDEEGVLDNRVTPFDGVYKIFAGRAQQVGTTCGSGWVKCCLYSTKL